MKTPSPNPSSTTQAPNPASSGAPQEGVDLVAENVPPTSVHINTTPADIQSRIRVVDAETGDKIDKVIEADAEAGTVTRYVVQNGSLVRDGDHIKTVTEERRIRIEWATGKQKASF